MGRIVFSWRDDANLKFSPVFCLALARDSQIGLPEPLLGQREQDDVFPINVAAAALEEAAQHVAKHVGVARRPVF
jgi:hypothetical protein